MKKLVLILIILCSLPTLAQNKKKMLLISNRLEIRQMIADSVQLQVKKQIIDYNEESWIVFRKLKRKKGKYHYKYVIRRRMNREDKITLLAMLTVAFITKLIPAL